MSNRRTSSWLEVNSMPTPELRTDDGPYIAARLNGRKPPSVPLPDDDDNAADDGADNFGRSTGLPDLRQQLDRQSSASLSTTACESLARGSSDADMRACWLRRKVRQAQESEVLFASLLRGEQTRAKSRPVDTGSASLSI